MIHRECVVLAIEASSSSSSSSSTWRSFWTVAAAAAAIERIGRRRLSPDLGLERNLERRQLMMVMGELATNPIPAAPMFVIPVLLSETLIGFRNEEAREGC